MINRLRFSGVLQSDVFALHSLSDSLTLSKRGFKTRCSDFPNKIL